jgi:hypothetical protein
MVEDQSSPENPLEQEPRLPFPEQQPLPGLESEMHPGLIMQAVLPGSGRLPGKAALIAYQFLFFLWEPCSHYRPAPR